MFEKKKATLKPEPIKRAAAPKKDDIPAHSGSTNVSNIAAMFERKKTVNMDQDKKKFLTKPAESTSNNTIANNPFIKNQNAVADKKPF